MSRSRLRAAQIGSAALVVGVMASGVATAAPAGGGMRSDLHRLRVCESGDNYREDSGNGYYGAYQFAERTWHAMGYRGRPDHARRVTQDHAAQQLHHQDGWAAWPSCSQTEHLR